jgi:transaldolase
MSTALAQLMSCTIVVADTGDIDSIIRLKPVDATTNPSLILKAAATAQYAELIHRALAPVRLLPVAAQLPAALEAVSVAFGAEILQHIPGVISTEVDARYSFDIAATLAQARRVIARYRELGIGRERVLVKIASTWEGICAARLLEQEGIHCNLTLLFNFTQAQAAAEANVTLISPFVGRILDWYAAHTGEKYSAETDPGVCSVKAIYQYYKAVGHKTIVMAASFRNTGEIRALAGCDKLTIGPALLDALATEVEPLSAQLTTATITPRPRLTELNEASFRWQLNQDAMATEKLAEGIRLFAADLEKLEGLLAAKLAYAAHGDA